MGTPSLPKTCAEAAAIFSDWERQAYYREEARCHRARAEILRMFGDQPVPQKLLDSWHFPGERKKSG
jgi:hypothetical protein